MTSRGAARALTALILASCLSGLVLANDAGSGGDVGNSTSTAYSLNATNATYFGNLTDTSDEDDYYSVSMPNNTGIYVELISPGYSGSNGTNSSSTCYNSSWPFYTCDFDLYLYDSAGTQLDYSDSASGYDDVTSNGSSVGGTTVYIRALHYDGDGQYALVINIFSTGGSGGGGGGGSGNNSTNNGHDAGTGTDAGDTYSTAMTLSAVNQSIWGDVHSSTDSYDYYRITIPTQYGFTLTLDWNGTSTSPDLDLELYDSAGTRVSYSWFSKPEVLGPNNGSGGTTYNIGVTAFSGSGDYNLNISFDNLSSSPVNNQNDAGTGDDASNDYNNPTSLTTNIGVNNFTGWVSSNDDAVDEYSTTVPANYGIAVSLEFDPSMVNYELTLALMPSPANNIIDSSATFSSPETVTSNGTYVGGETVLFEVYAYSGEGFYSITVWIFDLDSDGDGHWDDNETACGSDPDDPNSVPTDTDGDGLCDIMDSDDDGDGYNDSTDAFPLDNTEWLDTDNDEVGNNADEDDDNDGWSDVDEYQCNTNPTDYNSQPIDTDQDSTCDLVDDDDDGDGYLDNDDDFPLDADEWLDTDDDGIGNNADIDDDSDGFSDSIESTCGSDPLDASSLPLDTDQDGSCNAQDGDDDNDGFADVVDAFPLDAGEWIDTDGDGFGNNGDDDDDGDAVLDNADAFPLDAGEWEDNDGDGIGNNADLDDDQDGWSDIDEADCQTDPYSFFDVPVDFDADHICDRVDPDDDGDGIEDAYDMFQFDASEWDDLDFDGIGDNADADDDGDGWFDLDEPNCGTDPMDANSIPDDFDGDRICDPMDNDDDNDLIIDVNDAFQFDPSETKDTDADGTGDNSDTDDDGDGWPDNVEIMCLTDSLSLTSVPDDTDGDGQCDVIDADDDNDSVGDPNDAFPFDVSEWEDRNSDGLGDNANPLSVLDHIKLNPIFTALIVLVIFAAVVGTMVFSINRSRQDQAEIPWDDDHNYNSEVEADLPQEDPISSSPIAPSPPEPPERPLKPSDVEPSEPDQEDVEYLSPPPPPGFEKPPLPPGLEDLIPEPVGPVTASSWEDLPDGGDYVQTVPMQYVGEECGTWVRQPDDSWELQ